MRKTMLLWMIAAVWLLCPMLVSAESDTGKAEERPMLRAAIFVQNRAGADLQDQVDSLSDQLATALTGKGFSVLDRSLIIANLAAGKIHSRNDAALSKDLNALEQAVNDNKGNGGVEAAVTGASALRIAQMIGADYLVVASINSLGKETRTFVGDKTAYGSSNHSTVFNLRLSLKVLEADQGGSVYGDTVTASERIAAGENLQIDSSEILPKLIDSGARKIAERVAGNVERIRNVKVKSMPVVEYSVNSNVEGATIELDGAIIGSTPGHFAAAPGLHQLKVTKEWLSPWERTVNITQNQVLNVTLELSEEGLRRYATMEQLKAQLAHTRQQNEMEIREREAGLGIAKEQSEAEAFARKAVAEGQKTKPEESDEQLEREPTVAAPPAPAAPPVTVSGATKPTP